MGWPKYEVRRRRWPFPRLLQRPWELLRDDKPVGFYETSEQAEAVRVAVVQLEEDKSGPR